MFIYVFLFTKSSLIIDALINYYGIAVHSLSPAESIIARMNLGLIFSSILFIPLFIYQMISFSGEALSKKMKKEIKGKTFLGFFFALIGLTLGMTVFSKIILNGLMQYNIGIAVWGISSIIGTVAAFSIVLALAIQTIWFIPFIVKAKMVSKKALKKIRPFLLVGFLIFSAMITPPDIFSLILMMLVLQGSFEIGMLFTKTKEVEK